MTRGRILALWTAGICVAMLGVVTLMSRALSAQSTSTGASLASPDFTIPPPDVPCILSGNKLNLQCIIANDPDAKRIRAEEAGLEAQALAAAQSGTLDPYHQVQTLGELEIFDPNLAVNSNLACSYCHDPASGYANGVPILSVFTGGQPRRLGLALRYRTLRYGPQEPWPDIEVSQSAEQEPSEHDFPRAHGRP
jgi:hypothetical protein